MASRPTDPFPTGGRIVRKRCGRLLATVLSTTVLVTAGAGTTAGMAAAEQGGLGPVTAHLVRVIDGDTVRVRAHIWIDQQVEVTVRLEGADAAELNGRCEFERRLAREARARLGELLGDGGLVMDRIGPGKYGGRVVARVFTLAGDDIAQRLIEEGLARPYDGGGRGPWCDALASAP